MATSPSKKKAAVDLFVARFSEIIDAGAQEMDAAQLRESEKCFNDVIDHAVAKANHRKASQGARSPLKQQSARNSLLKSMDELALIASQKMSTDEVSKVRKQINQLVNRVGRRKTRRDTA